MISFSYFLSAFCAPCSVCESRKEDLEGAMLSIHLFLTELILSISRSNFWPSLKQIREMFSDTAMWT